MGGHEILEKANRITQIKGFRRLFTITGYFFIKSS